MYYFSYFYEEQYETVTEAGESLNIGSSKWNGRPKIDVSLKQIKGLSDLGFTWGKIAKMLGVSDSTLLRRRQELGINKNYRTMSDQELDAVMQQITVASPNLGERMIIGAPRSYGIKIQRWTVRESIGRVDSIGKELRKQRRHIERRVYQVPCPNALW